MMSTEERVGWKGYFSTIDRHLNLDSLNSSYCARQAMRWSACKRAAVRSRGGKGCGVGRAHPANDVLLLLRRERHALLLARLPDTGWSVGGGVQGGCV